MSTARPTTLGELIRRQRVAAGLTQENLAERAGLSVRAISDLERGVSSARRGTVQLLADALDLPPQERAKFEAGQIYPSARLWTDQSHNLPLQPTPFIGREREVQEVRQQLLRPDVRLLTLTGTGGTGKTRLALEAAVGLPQVFPAGVHFVSLAPISDPSLMTAAIAQILGAAEVAGQPWIETLKHWLGSRQVLLLLDSFEGVLDAAPTVTELLGACAELKVLVTSRAPLRVRGEREFSVPPLTVPDPDHLPDIDTLAHYEAVELFVQRVGDVRPNFRLDASNAEAVARICARLDGLPLAIELAAARARMLSPNALLSRLSSRLDLLKGGARDLPTRQQTIRATIDWSHDLLDDGGRQLFRRLGVFAGGWTLDAAEAVCSRQGDLDVLEAMSSLADKSLVQHAGETQGEPRFAMLEMVREYALERLADAAESEEYLERHADYFLLLAQAAEPELTDTKQVDWLKRLEAEHDNLRAALSWLLDHRKVEQAVRLASAVWRFWDIHAHVGEGRLWLDRSLALGGDLPPVVRAKALNGAGYLAWMQGDYGCAIEKLESSLGLRRELGDRAEVASSLNNLGLVALDQGNHDRAEALLQESLVLRRKLDNKWGVAVSLNNLAYAAMLRGDNEGAKSHAEASLAAFREMANTWGVALALTNLGRAALESGALERAESTLQEGLTLWKALGERRNIAECLEALAGLAAARMQVEQAARLWGAAEALREAVGAPLSPVERPQHERHLAKAQSTGDAGAFAAAWAEGRSMSLDDAVEHARQLDFVAENG